MTIFVYKMMTGWSISQVMGSFEHDIFYKLDINISVQTKYIAEAQYFV